MQSWIDRYIGIPYKFGGADYKGADCWGLVCLILKDIFQKELPRYRTTESTPAELADLIENKKQTVRKVSKPETGDIILLRIAGKPCHVGICVGGGYMIHSLKGHDSALERYDSMKWSKRIEGVYHVD